MAVNRVRVTWTGSPTVGDGLSTFYFLSSVGTPAQQASAVGDFLQASETARVDNCAWATQSDVATLNVGTGAVEAITSVTPETGAGTQAGDQMPPAVQGLLRMVTSQVVGGRLLRGRLFLPGAPELYNTAGGSPDATYDGIYESAAATLIANANADWMVWSLTHGVAASVGSAAVWSKWAVLRSRRD